MINNIQSLPVTALDLLSLFVLTGTLICSLFIVSECRTNHFSFDCEFLKSRLRWLLKVSLVTLIFTSLGELAERSMEMSDRPFSAILSVLPTILFQTHYGQLWLIRPVALIGLWTIWWKVRHPLDSRVLTISMLCLGTLISITRTASGHASDLGDFTLPELCDWLHLLTASIWGGGLLTLSTAVLSTTTPLSSHQLSLIVSIARRFSKLFGISLPVVILTGLYNAWLQVGDIQVLWRTSYGKILVAKLLLVFILMVLGASNRYLTLPFLQQWTGKPPALKALLYNLVTTLYRSPVRQEEEGLLMARKFRHKVRAEAIIMVGVILCTSLLIHGTPARHLLPLEHAHVSAPQTILLYEFSQSYE